MELRDLAHVDIPVSELCLGTLNFGTSVGEDLAARILDAFLDAGGNFVDTADIYGDGASEVILGRLLRGRRERVVLATKFGLADQSDPHHRGASRRHIVQALDRSLKRLSTDWVDLYQLHWPDESVGPEETFETLDELVRKGKIRSFGVSNYLGSSLVRALAVCENRGWARPSSLQQQYSLISRDSDLEMLPLCRHETVSFLAWRPLGGGILAGRDRQGEAASAGAGDRVGEIVELLAVIARQLGKVPSQIALNWVLHRPGVTSAIVGHSNVEQLAINLGSSGWKLEEEHLRALNRLSRPPLRYPHDMYFGLGIRRYD